MGERKRFQPHDLLAVAVDNIGALREQHGHGLRGIAGVASSHMGRVLRGEADMTLAVIGKIAKHYGVHPWQLLQPALGQTLDSQQTPPIAPAALNKTAERKQAKAEVAALMQFLVDDLRELIRAYMAMPVERREEIRRELEAEAKRRRHKPAPPILVKRTK